MILTRYLYDKGKVEETLNICIEKQDFQQSLFWGYELYYSGFQQEVLKLLENIYKTRFSKNHPKLGIYIKRKMVNTTQEIVATIIKNLTMKNADIQESTNAKFVNVKSHHIESFMTKEVDRPWKLLREVCLYGVIGKAYNLQEFRKNWLLYCLKTPIWLERIKEYGGRFEMDKIDFQNEDQEEAFYNRYDCEPDEQSLEIQQRCIGK